MATHREGSPQPTGRRQRILLAEDTLVVRTVYALLLRRAGYEVAETGSGHEALEALASRMPDPDLLLTDFDMPGMDGVLLALTVRERRPGVRVLLVSVSPEHLERARSLLPFATCLPKPDNARDLAATVAQVLADSPPPPA